MTAATPGSGAPPGAVRHLRVHKIIHGGYLLYGSPEISGHECASYRRPRFDNRQPYRAGGAEAQATAQSERTRPWLLANRFQAISQASMMSARLENTELASQ